MLRYGFFDSIKGDRKYNARDVSKLFDGIILDGIFAAVGDHFSVNVHPTQAMTLTVGTGQAWLNHVKVINTSPMSLTFDTGSSNRYDAIVVEVNELERTASIFIKKDIGKPSSQITTGVNPIDMSNFTNNVYIHQYLLAYALIRAGQNKISTADVASRIGFASPEGIPYVTGPLETLSADETLKQWVAQWEAFYNGSNTYLNTFKTNSGAALTAFQNNSAQEINTFKSNSTSEINSFKTKSDSEINTFKSNCTDALNTFAIDSAKFVQDWIASEETDWNTWFDGKKEAWDELWEYVTEELTAANIAETYATKTELGNAVVEVKDYTDTKVGTKANTASPTFTGTPKAPTPATTTNNTQIATTAFVKSVVNALINGAPETLDTLKEIADAIGANETIVEALNTAIGTKANVADVLPLSGGIMTGVLIPNEGISYAGITNYIAYPDDGFLISRISSNTGYLRITLPQSWTSTMITFIVSIYDYNDNCSVDYHISGYNYSQDSLWKSCTAVCIGKAENRLSNLKVMFGHDGEKCAITIGQADTIFKYPVVKVHDILTGYNNYYYPLWKSGWEVEITTEELPVVNVTLFNTNITYNCTAKKAMQDGDGKVIKDTYATKAQFEEVFQSVSNGKELIASAITDKGVTTASDATFQTMADNIATISSGSPKGNAVASDVLSGKTFSSASAGSNITGTMTKNTSNMRAGGYFLDGSSTRYVNLKIPSNGYYTTDASIYMDLASCGLNEGSGGSASSDKVTGIGKHYLRCAASSGNSGAIAGTMGLDLTNVSQITIEIERKNIGSPTIYLHSGLPSMSSTSESNALISQSGNNHVLNVMNYTGYHQLKIRATPSSTSLAPGFFATITVS